MIDYKSSLELSVFFGTSVRFKQVTNIFIKLGTFWIKNPLFFVISIHLQFHLFDDPKLKIEAMIEGGENCIKN